MIDSTGREVPQGMLDVLADITTDGRYHSLYHIPVSGGPKCVLGVCSRIADRWVFRPYKNQHYDSNELWLIMRYLTELAYTQIDEEFYHE